jgi:hypothetical protein
MDEELEVTHLQVERRGGSLHIAVEGRTPTLGWTAVRLEEAGRSGGTLRLRLVGRRPEGMAAQMVGEVRAQAVAGAEGLAAVEAGRERRPVPPPS